MAIVHIFDNSGTPGGESASLSDVYEFAVAFTLSSNQFLRELRWYRYAASGSRVPGVVRVWDVGAQQQIYAAGIIPDGNTAAWQTHTLGAQVPLASGREYRVSYGFAVGQTLALYSGAPTSPPSPLSIPTTWKYYRQGSLGFPGSSPYASGAVAVDVGVDSTPPEGSSPSPTSGDISNGLVAWLADTNDNTHRAGDAVPGLPDTIKVAVDAVAGDVTTLVTRLDNVTSGEVTTYGLRGQSIGAGIAGVLGFVNTALDLATKLHDLLSANGTGGDSYDYHGALEDARQKTYDIESAIAALPAPYSPAPVASFPTGWTMLAETTFDTDLAWAQAADLYVVGFTDLGSNLVNTVVAGVNVSYRLAWWTPLNGAHAQQRRFIDTPDYHAVDGGQSMPGILLHSPAGATGNVQAWQRP